MRKTTTAVLMGLALILTGCTNGNLNPEETLPAPTVESPAPEPTSPPEAETAPPVEPAPPAPEETPEPEPAPPVASGSLLSAIDALVVADEAYAEAYERSLFNHWTSSDGCDTRFKVLVRDGQNVNYNGCSFEGGEWFSSYDQVTTNDPGTFDIDHMVPLKEAWRSGAYGWDDATREAYANDMGYQYSLVAVSASSNRSKSDSDLSSWMQVADKCEYITQWTTVKTRWALTVDPMEKDVLVNTAQECGDRSFEMPSLIFSPEHRQDMVPEPPAAAPAPVEVPAAPPVAEAAPGGATDPQFGSCKEAKSQGFGPYVQGQDAEYDWYRDGDGDGTVCE